MLRLPWYVARLRSEAMTAVTQPEVITDLGALAVLDGKDGVGQVIIDIATQDAVDRARTHGVGVVAVRNSNHFGTAAYWTRRMADRGCVGILTTNGSPAMAPWGGLEKTVGANPWSVATPGGSHPPVVLDIANTGVARGKIYAAAQRGEQIPDTWALDERGVPTTDPNVAITRPARSHGRAQGLRHLVRHGRALGRPDRQRLRHGRRRSLRPRPSQPVRPPGRWRFRCRR